MTDAIRKLLEHETAGDPVRGLKWTRKTTQKIADAPAPLGIQVASTTVGRLLKAMDFSLKVNQKSIGAGRNPDRNTQFEYIGGARRNAEAAGIPVISVDAKKRELVGAFKNAGAAWCHEARQVNDHDFPSLAQGVAVPYGIYDTGANRGFVCVGVSGNTAQFAADAIERWWRAEGRQRYADAGELLILADGGGSNGCRCRLWKSALQETLCDRHGIVVTVAHYPTGASKWNPIEHRLFSAISRNWAGVPLESYETVLNYIRTTKTTPGLRVRAQLVTREYETRIRVSDERMNQLNITPHDILPKWNYTLRPFHGSS